MLRRAQHDRRFFRSFHHMGQCRRRTMSALIDDISRAIASPVSRRKAFKMVSGAVGGALLTSLGLGRATRALAAGGNGDAPCPHNGVKCGGKCYPAGYCCCGNTYCDGSHHCCNDHCCANSQTCCGSGCCNSGSTCCGGSQCCPKPQSCCGSTCCSPQSTCCGNNTCCPCGVACCSGKCCSSPRAICCGGACCPEGYLCCANKCVKSRPSASTICFPV